MVIAACHGFHRIRLEGDEARWAVEEALAALIGEPVELQVVLADSGGAPASAQVGKRQEDAALPAGLPPEMADDPLVRVAVHELGAVVRTP